MSEIRATAISDINGTGPVSLTKQATIKSWAADVSTVTASINGDTFNVSSYTDIGTGQGRVNMTNNMNTTTYAVLFGCELQYPYHAISTTVSTYALETVNGTGNFIDGSQNGAVLGDLA